MVTRARKPKAATPAQQQWNMAADGLPKLGRVIDVPGSCATEHCGRVADELDESDPTFEGWTRAGVYGSSEPDRVYCSGLCATYGIALAELRVERRVSTRA